MSPVLQGCPCHGHLNLLGQPADRLYMKFQLPTLIDFCVVTAHNGQDECQLGELLKHIKKSRHCIVFKGTFMSHPSAQRAETRVCFQGFITFGEVKQTNGLGFFFFCILTKLRMKQLFSDKSPPRTLGTYAAMPSFTKNASVFPLRYK